MRRRRGRIVFRSIWFSVASALAQRLIISRADTIQHLIPQPMRSAPDADSLVQRLALRAPRAFVAILLVFHCVEVIDLLRKEFL